MACASSPSRRRGCTVPAHVRVTGQTGQCAAGTGTCTAVGKEGTRGRPRRYRLLPTRPARQASTPYLRVRLLFATPGGIDRTSSAGSHATVHGTQNRERRRRKPPRQGAARGDPPGPCVRGSHLFRASGIRNNSSLATGKKLGRPSLCGTSQLGWCVPGRLWDDPPLSHPTFAWDIPDGWNVPRDVGRPTRLGCPSSAGLSQFGWAVPVWLGCPSCGPSHLGAGCPISLGHPSLAWDVPRGRAVPVWLRVVPVRLGCPSLAGVSQLWSSHFEASCPTPLVGPSAAWDVLWVGCPSSGRLSRVLLGCPSFHWVVEHPARVA